MQTISAVILDLDGLMIDTERVARRAWRRAASDFGYTIEDAVFSRLSGRKPGDVRGIVLDAQGEDFPYDEIRERRDNYLLEAFEREEVKAKEGLFDILETIDDLGLDVAIATSGLRESTKLKLSAIGLSDRFETVVSGDDVEHGKPAPDIFLQAARRLDVPPARCVVLEDSNVGARAAHAAGMRVVVVPEFEEPPEDVKEIAWRVLPSLHEAARHLEHVVEAQN
jgi:HAD superfamily hydrolase (TIGR01509 family)